MNLVKGTVEWLPFISTVVNIQTMLAFESHFLVKD